MLDDIEGGGRGHDGDHESLVRELGQVMVLAMKGHDPTTETSGVVHTVQQSFIGAIGGDDQDRVVSSDCRQSAHGDGEMGRRVAWGCPSDPGGHQVGAARGLRLLGHVGHEVPRLIVGGADHQERATAL